jgi:hypothetical protein
MKKLLLFLVVAMGATFANAQTRTVDLAVDSIFGADTLNSTTTAGTPVAMHFMIKNLGPDTVWSGDSLLYQFLIINANNQVIAATPANQGSYWVKVLTDTLAPGDSLEVMDNRTITQYPNNSLRAVFAISAFVINSAKGITALEPSSTNANNIKGKVGVWMSPFGFGVGLKEFADVNLSVYPNPVSDVLNFDIDNNKAARVEIMDIAGRKVDAANFEMNHASVDVRNYNKGIYLYQVLNSDGQVVKTGKITVN